MESNKSALGVDENINALLCYIIVIIALINVFIEKDNKFVRFHSFQSLLLLVAYIVGIVLLVILGAIAAIMANVSGALAAIIGIVVVIMWFVVIFGFLGAIIYCAIKAYGGNKFKLPVIGDLAEKFAA